MIKFFRKIRKNLLSEGKTRTYFTYAIGEIILVVIGILIALSINNWNEKRKDNIIEKQLLNEMLTSLKSDREVFLMLKNRLIKKDSAIQKILNLKERGELPFGKSFGGLMGVARQHINFTYDKSPYENLVALGINKMSNKELLKAINEYYTQNLPRSIKFIELVKEKYLPKLEKYEDQAIESGILKKLFVKRDGDDKWSVSYQSNPTRLFQDEQFYQSMINDFKYMENSLGRLSILIRQNEKLIQLLEKKE